jgi:hypothetical protein
MQRLRSIVACRTTLPMNKRRFHCHIRLIAEILVAPVVWVEVLPFLLISTTWLVGVAKEHPAATVQFRQPPPAGRRRRILIGQEPPYRPGLQYQKEALQARPVGGPTDGLACPCAASAQAAEVRSTPTAHHSTTGNASCSCKKFIKPFASCRSPQLEAGSIYL